jgi:hypothetical protein
MPNSILAILAVCARDATRSLTSAEGSAAAVSSAAAERNGDTAQHQQRLQLTFLAGQGLLSGCRPMLLLRCRSDPAALSVWLMWLT